MSIENTKKLLLGVDKTCNCEKYISCDNVTREMMQPIIDEGMDLIEGALSSGEMDVLETSMSLFSEDNENGVCESLMSDIWRYYSVDQIIKALSLKFEQLLDMNIMRSVQFFGYCMNAGHFKEMRKIFNTTKSSKSKEFLDEFDDWYKEDYPKEIEILQKDMQDWSSQLKI